ncbi:uncharacterized protein EMH_0004800 [Eimeria mitis]|uniref:Obg domain-containing protein n=1 Tax=Eimeria mitis TaxID=44415 RepID=U6KJF1_9EIME|nr:uncharacterized protein EMH_0004800 [Eimeria mitis]CDJ35588.1 hypothetical protein, conserved [Eimeria mitis]
MSSSSGAGAATAPLVNGPQEPPCRLLGGGLSLNPSLIFALAARRLLQQGLQQIRQLDDAPASAEGAAAAASVSDVVFSPVTVEGGSGGDGSIAFLRLRAAPRSGAAGGSGGRGGCVLLRAVGASEEAAGAHRRLSALKESGCWRAASGGIGAGQGKTGAHGPDLLLGLPPNSLVVDVSAVQAHAAGKVRRLLQQQQQDDETATEAEVELQSQQQEGHQQQGEQLPPLCCIYFAAPGDTLVAARGGMGGRGNLAFVSNSNRHPLVGETGAPGERRKLLVLHNFSDFVVVGRMQSGKSTLLRALSAVATASAAETNARGAAAHANGSAAGTTAGQRKLRSPEVAPVQPGEQQQQQQQQQQLQWLSAAVPEDVWLPTAEPTICVIPAPTRRTAAPHNLAAEQTPSDGLVDMLKQGIALASAAPIVAVDTPGLLPPAPPAAPAATGAVGTAPESAESMLMPAGQQQDEPLKGLTAGTSVVLVVDSSLPDPALECVRLRQQLLQESPELADLPFIVVLNKIDMLQQRQSKQQRVSRKLANLVERVKTQTGIGGVYAVSALRGDGCRELFGALRKAAGLDDLSAEQQQLLLSHFKQQHQQQHLQQQKKLGPGAYSLAFLTAYSAAAMSAPHSLLLFSVHELLQQQQQPGATLMRRPAAAPPLRVSTGSSKKHPYPSFPSLEDPYKWIIVERREQGTLQRLLQAREVLHASPDFASEESSRGRRCFELKGPLVSLLTEPVKFNSEAAKLRLYRQLSALGIVERAFTDHGASIGDYLLVGPVLLQLLPLLRHSKGRKKGQQAPLWGGDTWEIFKTDGLPKKGKPESSAFPAAALMGIEESVSERLKDTELPDFEAAPFTPNVRPYTATDPRAVQQRRRVRRKITEAIRHRR